MAVTACSVATALRASFRPRRGGHSNEEASHEENGLERFVERLGGWEQTPLHRSSAAADILKEPNRFGVR